MNLLRRLISISLLLSKPDQDFEWTSEAEIQTEKENMSTKMPHGMRKIERLYCNQNGAV